MKAEDARAHVARRLGSAGASQRLGGGLLNHVFRVELPASAAVPRGTPGNGARSVILKHAPPHVATKPDIALDPSRSDFEARALRWLAARASEAPVAVRTPRLLDQDGSTLIMEDLGAELVSLDRWLEEGDPAVLDRLGRWLRWLHDVQDPPRLHNLPVQQTRWELQYKPAAEYLRRGGIDDPEIAAIQARYLGLQLREPGDAFVMGDLWPASVLLNSDGDLHLIDWELSTLGRRCQDLGHLAAWLWMLGHRGRIPTGLAGRFLAAAGPISEQDHEESAVHFGCEILARTTGAFADGGPYAELSPGDAPVQQAVSVAEAAMRSGELPTV